jgi:hypothetical protein
MRRLMREIASGKGLNRVMPLDGSVTEGSLLNTGKPEISTGHHIDYFPAGGDQS